MSISSLPAAGSERPPDDIDQERRRFLGVAAAALATTWLGAAAEAGVQVFEPRTAGNDEPDIRRPLPQEAPAFAQAIMDVDRY